MKLEDHLGDILRKARQAGGVSAAAAAKAATGSETDLNALEETGQVPKGANLSALAQVLGLNGQKLQTIAGGWLPQSPDLTLWRELRVITTTREGITVNCCLVWDEISHEGALFDTGWEADPILALVSENGVQLRHLFLTHTHEDHIAAMEIIRQQFPKLH